MSGELNSSADSEAIVGGLGGLKMASSFSDSAGSTAGGCSRSQSPTGEQVQQSLIAERSDSKVSPPAAGTQDVAPPTHVTPSTLGMTTITDDSGTGLGPRPNLPFRMSSHGGIDGGGGGNPSTAAQMQALTPVIRNTSSSGDDLDEVIFSSSVKHLISPDKPGQSGDGGSPPHVLELSIPRAGDAGSHLSTTMKHLPPRPSRPAPQAAHVQASEPEGPSDLSIDIAAAASTAEAQAEAQAQTQTNLNLNRPSRQATRSYSAGNLDSESLVKTVREYYSHQEPQPGQEPQPTGSTSSGSSRPSAAPKSGDSQEPLQEEALLHRTEQSEAYMDRRRQSDAHREEEQQQDSFPPLGPPIPFPKADRRAHSFDRRPPAGAHSIKRPMGPLSPGSPKPTISMATSASPGRSGLPPLPGSTGPASKYLHNADRVQPGTPLSISPIQYQPTRDQSLTEIGRVGDEAGLQSIFKEGRRSLTIRHSPKRPVPTPGSHSSIFQPSSQDMEEQTNASAAALRNPIPLEQRDWSIPSIRLANHVNAGDSCATVETYEDLLDDEDHVDGGDFDDATLSSRGSKPSSDNMLTEDHDDVEEDRKLAPVPPAPSNADRQQIFIEQGMDAVTHLADDAGPRKVGDDSVHAVAAPPSVFRKGGTDDRRGQKKKHRKNNSPDEALEWLESVKVSGVAEAASSKFLTGSPLAAASASAAATTSPVQGVPGALKPYAVNRQTSLPASSLAIAKNSDEESS